MMKSIEIRSQFLEYDSLDELPDTDRNLILAARKSMMDAYAPYSQFKVGAAILLENGKVILGNNQENASYPVGMCAERVAIFSAGANFPGIPITTIAITAQSEQFVLSKPVTPCGACRQAISEYEHRYSRPIRLIFMGETGKVLVTDSITQLLPYQFTADDLQLKSK